MCRIIIHVKLERAHIEVDGIQVEVVRKDIKNLNLSVRPPDGGVRVSAPRRFSDAQIRRVIVQRLGWIRRKKSAILKRRPPRPEYVSGESLMFRGERCVLCVSEREAAPSVRILDGRRLELTVRPGADRARREAVLHGWYRRSLKEQIPDLIAKWEPEMGVSVAEWRIKRMKTRWGSCNARDRRVWLNLELAKRSPRCLEYVLVHEMVHLLERRHSARFHDLMDSFLPDWRLYKDELNQVSL